MVKTTAIPIFPCGRAEESTEQRLGMLHSGGSLNGCALPWRNSICAGGCAALLELADARKMARATMGWLLVVRRTSPIEGPAQAAVKRLE